MTPIKTIFEEIIHILREKKTIVIISIALTTVALVLVGTTFGMEGVAKEESKDFEETYGEKKYYYMGESLSDKDYINYVHDESNVWYERLCSFREQLINSDQFTFINIIEQPLYFMDTEVPEIFLDGYEDGWGSDSVQEIEGETMFFVKAIEVSENFFDDAGITITNGSPLVKEDFKYSGDNTVPVVLGSEYQNYFSVGDKIRGDYLGAEVEFIVKGFIAKQSYYMSLINENMISLSRYVVAPAFDYSAEDVEVFSGAKIALLQEMNARILTDLSFDSLDNIISQMLVDSGIGTWDIGLIDTSHRMGSELYAYSQMTKEVARQFNVLVYIMLVITCIAIILVLIGMIREEQINFGIMLLCGASYKTIALLSAGLGWSILIIGDIIATLIVFAIYGVKAAIIIQIITAAIVVISTIATILFLNRMNISEVMGGKE